jgi:hypothetical protein
MGRRSGLGSIVLLLSIPASLQAQATLTGTVRLDSSKTAVAGVEVLIQAANRKATTDTAGRFVLDSLAHGIHSVVVRSIGYRPIALRAYLVSNDTLDVTLFIRKSPVELAPLEVTASAVPMGLEGFERRRHGGWGSFVDWTTLRKQEFRLVSDIVRDMSGVYVRYDGRGQAYMTGRGDCPMAIYLDGLPIFKGPGRGGPPAIDDWNVSNLDAIEAYAGPSATPSEFGGIGSDCGTVLFWSRRH